MWEDVKFHPEFHCHGEAFDRGRGRHMTDSTFPALLSHGQDEDIVQTT